MTTLSAAVLLGLIHTSIVALVTILARLCVPRRLAAVRATIGVVGMACILILTGLALLPIPGVWPAAPARLAESAVTPQQAPAVEEPANESPNATAVLPSSPVSTESDSDADAQLPLFWIQRLGAGVERATAAAEAPPRGWQWFLLSLVLSGSAISLLRLALATWSVQRLRAASRFVRDGSIESAIDELKRRCGCLQAIEVRETEQLASAAAFGWRRPVILLPADWRQWSSEELAAVLAHEVAHIHRADYIHRLVALAGAAVYFYHPLVRAAVRRLAIDQELAADRLARGLGESERAYARGLARLALRYHDSLRNSLYDRRAWSSVSLMPRSSDFLARRLEMLRVRNEDGTEKRATKLISYGASACLVAIALATALLRGASADEKQDQTPPPAATTEPQPIETARLPVKPAIEKPASAVVPVQELFSRDKFDPSMIRPGTNGGFLIRVGDIMRHPEVEPHVEGLNKMLSELFEQFLGDSLGEQAIKTEAKIDLRDIEWLAGDLNVFVKRAGPYSQEARLMIGSGGMVVRMARASSWRETILKHVPGSELKEYKGKRYVQLPALPALGRLPVRMRFPDAKTIVMHLSTRENLVSDEAEDKLLEKFLDDTPASHAWAKDWRAVDGGLVTLLFDNSKAGWADLPAEKRGPQFVAPLAEKSNYIVAGWDWTEKTNRTAFRVRATCADQEGAKEVHLAAMTALSYWPEMLLEWGDDYAKYHKRILQLFSTLKVQRSDAAGGEHFVQATADVGWDPKELVGLLSQYMAQP